MSENLKPCEKCKNCDQGTIHGYPWMTCTKNWSDKVNGVFYGVLKNTCANFVEKKEKTNV